MSCQKSRLRLKSIIGPGPGTNIYYLLLFTSQSHESLLLIYRFSPNKATYNHFAPYKATYVREHLISFMPSCRIWKDDGWWWGVTGGGEVEHACEMTCAQLSFSEPLCAWPRCYCKQIEFYAPCVCSSWTCLRTHKQTKKPRHKHTTDLNTWPVDSMAFRTGTRNPDSAFGTWNSVSGH